MKMVAFITEIAFLATVISACGGDSASNPETLTALSDESKPVEMSSSVREELSGDLSSSGRTQSSASISSSSSSAVAIGIDPSTVVAGTLTDSRDGQTYRTVKIGEQVWMAENLNYKVENSYCYNDENSNCDKYGRLYTWDAAMDACPSGWHLPSQTEWNTLLNTLGGNAPTGRKNSERLRSTLGWIKGNGTDAFSFSTLSAGGRGRNGDYGGEGHSAYFWSSTEDRSRSVDAYIMRLDIYGVQLSTAHKVNGYSVRCLKGDAPVQTQESSSSETAISSSSVKSSSSVTASSSSVENTSIQQPKSSGCSVTYKGVSYELNGIGLNFNALYTNFLNDAEIVYGTVHTLSNQYKTVTIGSYEWMAENMRDDGYTVSVYPYGKLGNSYSWKDATEVCPIGWHLPTVEEWEYLYEYLGKKVGEMQAVEFDGWPNATNGSGLSIIPAGVGGNAIRCPHGLGTKVIYWSGTQTRPWVVESDTAYSLWNHGVEPTYFYVRCVKNL